MFARRSRKSVPSLPYFRDGEFLCFLYTAQPISLNGIEIETGSKIAIHYTLENKGKFKVFFGNKAANIEAPLLPFNNNSKNLYFEFIDFLAENPILFENFIFADHAEFPDFGKNLVLLLRARGILYSVIGKLGKFEHEFAKKMGVFRPKSAVVQLTRWIFFSCHELEAFSKKFSDCPDCTKKAFFWKNDEIKFVNNILNKKADLINKKFLKIPVELTMVVKAMQQALPQDDFGREQFQRFFTSIFVSCLFVPPVINFESSEQKKLVKCLEWIGNCKRPDENDPSLTEMKGGMDNLRESIETLFNKTEKSETENSEIFDDPLIETAAKMYYHAIHAPHSWACRESSEFMARLFKDENMLANFISADSDQFQNIAKDLVYLLKSQDRLSWAIQTLCQLEYEPGTFLRTASPAFLLIKSVLNDSEGIEEFKNEFRDFLNKTFGNVNVSNLSNWEILESLEKIIKKTEQLFQKIPAELSFVMKQVKNSLLSSCPRAEVYQYLSSILFLRIICPLITEDPMKVLLAKYLQRLAGLDVEIDIFDEQVSKFEFTERLQELAGVAKRDLTKSKKELHEEIKKLLDRISEAEVPIFPFVSDFLEHSSRMVYCYGALILKKDFDKVFRASDQEPLPSALVLLIQRLGGVADEEKIKEKIGKVQEVIQQNSLQREQDRNFIK